MRIRSINPARTHTPIGRYVSLKEQIKAKQILNDLNSNIIEPIDRDLSNIETYFKIYCKLIGFKESDLMGDIGRDHLLAHYRRIFSGVIAMIYDPNLFDGRNGSKAKKGLRPAIAKVMNMNHNKVSDHFSSAIEQSFFPDLSVIWQEMESFKSRILSAKNKL